ncbi:MAG: putative bifunctional diguanylate cyclase/phosphodiesterase [Janthinobacterium lividum]
MQQYDLIGSEVDLSLETVVSLARSLFQVPIATVSLVGEDKQVFLGQQGLDVCETGRDVSFCAHAIGRPDVFVVPDARLDPRFSNNPLVTGDPHIRFYAGVPLRSPTGHDIGTLCIIDRRPRIGFSDADKATLRMLSTLVLEKLELRRLEVAREQGQSRFENIAATSPDGIICADHNGLITFWNDAAEQLFGYSALEATGGSIDLIVPAAMRGSHGAGLHRVAAGGAPRLIGTSVELDAEHRSGRILPIELSLSMWHDRGLANFGAIIRDMTERRANEERLYRLAHLDALTGLPNRSLLFSRIAEQIARREPMTVMLLDLDGFKAVNDTLGHSAGDKVLQRVAARIAECIRPSDTVARLGGDEFAILRPSCAGGKSLADELGCLLGSIASPVDVDGYQVTIGTSIGVACFPDHGEHVEDLLSAADLALYQAKADGRLCYRVFEPRLRDRATQGRMLDGELRRATTGGEFKLFYQPQVSIAEGHLVGAEALLRWQHPTRGLLSPHDFLAGLEASTVAEEAGEWIIETAIAQAAAWRRRCPDFTMAVNLFGAQFRDGHLATKVISALERHGLPPRALELEITENVILRHDDTMMEPLQRLRDEGVNIAFDDFGTGYASLSMLKRYPLTKLKIDRSFTTDLDGGEIGGAIVNAIISMAKSLSLEVIAEGVETRWQADLLRAAGCNLAQGYLYGVPEDADTFDRTHLRRVLSLAA